MKTFDLGTVLSITAGPLLTKMENVYDILNYMTGESLFTHQLPRACRVCGPAILKQHPQLADVDASSVNTENWRLFLEAQIQRFGPTLEIASLGPKEGWAEIDPLTELGQMVGPEKVVVIGTGGRDED